MKKLPNKSGANKKMRIIFIFYKKKNHINNSEKKTNCEKMEEITFFYRFVL